MEYSIFADESGINPEYKCYAIGALVIANEELDDFNNTFYDLKKKHGVRSEVKWQKISTSHGQINFGIDIFKEIINKNYRFSSIVVLKEKYRKWQGNKDEAFYTTYTQLLAHRVRESQGQHTVYMDQKKESYDKHHEVVQIIANYMAKQKSITGISKNDSKLFPGIQAADLITGAITASHDAYLNEKDIRIGKRLLIEKFAEMLGWDSLHYDTMPSSKFNIWHFPQEYRRTPATKRIRYNTQVKYIVPEALN